MQSKLMPQDKRENDLGKQLTGLSEAAWDGIIAGGCPHRGMVPRAPFRARPQTKNLALGPMILGALSCPRPPMEKVGNFQVLVKLSSMNTNTSVSIACIYTLVNLMKRNNMNSGT